MNEFKISNEDQNYNTLIGEDKSGIDKFLEKLKKSTFEVLSILLKDEEEEGVFMFCIQTTFDYIQMLEFIFNEKINHIWKADSVLQQIFAIFSFFQIGAYLGNTFNWTIYLISFYACILAIVLTILDIIYVSISFRRGKFAWIWPLHVLREVVPLSITVFFLPITEFLISMVECQTDDNGILVHSSYDNIQCWRGMHLLHGTVALVNIFIFVVISLIVALNYFESRITSNNPTARSNSRADVVFIINKIMLQTTFAFVPQEWDWPLVILIFVGGLGLWYLYQFDDPYYNEIISKLFKILSGYYMWTCLMLFVAKILENTTFKGGLISWIIGLPFIIIIMISDTKGNIETLTKSQVKFETPDQLMDHLRFVLQLIEKQKNSKNAYLLLAGYIEKHKEVCLEDDCPLKTGTLNSQMSFAESLEKLTEVIGRMYINGVKKFKKSAKLRIVYAFFLLERMKNKVKASEELKIAGSLNPHFDEEFLIFRYKKIIDDQLDESKGNVEDTDLDVVSAIALDNHKNTCESSVKKAGKHHRDFWKKLLDQIPNIDDLSKEGSQINASVKAARDAWTQMRKYKSNNPRMLKLYGKFSYHVLNEKMHGMMLLKECRQTALEQLERNKGEVLDIEKVNMSIALIGVQFKLEDKRIDDKEIRSLTTEVKKTNGEFCALFGYGKDDNEKFKFNEILPNLYAMYHDSYVINYIDRTEKERETDRVGPPIEEKYLGKDRATFAKLSNKYILPMTIKVRLFPSSKNESKNTVQFIGTFRTEASVKNYLYYLTASKGEVTDITSNSITYFHFRLEHIEDNLAKLTSGTQKKDDHKTAHRIKEILPRIEVANEFKTENGHDIELTIQNKPCIYNIKVEDIDLLQEDIKVDTLQSRTKGYLVRIEPKPKKNKNRIVDKERDSQITNPNEILSNFDKSIDHMDIYRFFNDGYKKDEAVGTLLTTEDHLFKKRSNSDKSSKGKEGIQYGAGIEVSRIVNNILYDIGENHVHIEEEDGQERSFDIQKSVFKANINLFGARFEDESSNKKRHDVIKEAINNVKEIKSISIFKVVSFFWILAIISLSTLELYFSNSYFSETSVMFNTLIGSNKEFTLLSKLSSHIYDLEFIDKGIYTEENFASYDSVITEMNTTLLEILQNTNYIESFQILDRIGRSDDTFKFTDYISSSPSLQDSIQVSYSSMITYLISSSLNTTKNFLNGESPTSKHFSESDLSLLKSNLYTSLYTSSLSYSSSLYDTLSLDLSSIFSAQLYIIVLLFLQALLTFFFIFYFIWLKQNIESEKEKILFLFLDIPKKEVVVIFRKCEKFNNFCENFGGEERAADNGNYLDSEDEEDSFDEEMNEYIKFDEDDDDQDDNEYEASNNKKKVIRLYREKRRGNQLDFNILLIGILAICFGVGNMVGIYIQQERNRYYLVQLNSNTLMESHFFTCLNTHRQAIIDPNYKMLVDTAKNEADECVKHLFENDAELFEFQNFISTISTNFTNLFEQTYFQNTCTTLPPGYPDCLTIVDGNLQNGITFVQNYIFSWMDIFNSLLNTDVNDPKYTAEYIKKDEPTRKAMIEISNVLKKHINAAISILIESEKLEMQANSDTTNKVLVVLLVLYIIGLFVFYSVWIYPTATRLNTEIKITIKMLNMIPINVIMNIPSIRSYLMRLAKNN